MLLVEVQQGLAIRAGAQVVALRSQVARELAVVVDLAVGDQPQRAVLVRQRLVPAGEIDDRQPPHPDRQRAVGVDALVVGPAMARDPAHARDDLRRHRRAGEVENAVDAAHGR